MKINNTEYILKMNELRLRRKKLKLSIKAIAEELGISRSAISQYEALRATLSDETIAKYEAILERKEGCKKWYQFDKKVLYFEITMI